MSALKIMSDAINAGTYDGGKDRAECRRLERVVFKADLEKAYSLETHPKKDRLFELAWEAGHSSGLWEVAMQYDQLSELLS